MTSDDGIDLVAEVLSLTQAERAARMQQLRPDERVALERAMQQRGITSNQLMNYLGGHIVELNDEYAVVELEVTDNVRQQTGAVHASVMIAIADLAASSLAGRASGASGPLAIDIHASLVANQTSGTIRAEARFVRHGRRVSVVRTIVTGDEGRILAQVTVTLVPAMAPDGQLPPR